MKDSLTKIADSRLIPRPDLQLFEFKDIFNNLQSSVEFSQLGLIVSLIKMPPNSYDSTFCVELTEDDDLKSSMKRL